MTETAEPIEVVILSGPRRGEIVRLPADAVPEVSEQDIRLLNDALDDLITAIDRTSEEIRATSAAVRRQIERL